MASEILRFEQRIASRGRLPGLLPDVSQHPRHDERAHAVEVHQVRAAGEDDRLELGGGLHRSTRKPWVRTATIAIECASWASVLRLWPV
jgi:hypothetical protein